MDNPMDPTVQILPISFVLGAFDPRVRPSLRALRQDMVRAGFAFSWFGRAVTTRELAARYLATRPVGAAIGARTPVPSSTGDQEGASDVREALAIIEATRKKAK